jgi:GNAT superfamily N-acetyltransferase
LVLYRIATAVDLPELAAMRWDFRLEEAPGTPAHDRDTFLRACGSFLQQGLDDQRWAYWIAATDTQILAHIFIQRIPKVPKPNRLDDALGYVTNVYTRPAYRNQGIGTKLMAHVLRWAADQDLESLIVWPSAASTRFYQRAGFRGSADMLEYEVRPYVL